MGGRDVQFQPENFSGFASASPTFSYPSSSFVVPQPIAFFQLAARDNFYSVAKDRGRIIFCKKVLLSVAVVSSYWEDVENAADL